MYDYGQRTRAERLKQFDTTLPLVGERKFQTHHLIPKEFANHPALKNYNVNGKDNLMILPANSSVQSAMNTDRQTHSAFKLGGYSHNNYNNYVGQLLQNLSQKPGGATANDIRQLQNHLRAELKKPPENSSWNKGNGGGCPPPPTKAQSGLPSESNKHFASLLAQTGLLSSYSSSHPDISFARNAAFEKEIGGVSASAGVVQAAKLSPNFIWDDIHYFCVRLEDGESLPQINGYNDPKKLISTLFHEITVGHHVHHANPFFSLHFNNQACLYPVLHPYWQNTLVGHVIGLLDYFMKGFLNGGCFSPEFIYSWPQIYAADPIKAVSPEYLRQHIIDLKTYCKKHGIDDYLSLREALALHGLDSLQFQGEKNNSDDRISNFACSFRIIAKQESFQRTKNLFELDPKFDVFYTITPCASFQQKAQQEARDTGQEPQDMKKMNDIYKAMAKRVETVMPNLPMFQPYFRLLSVISFLTYYVATLKDIGKCPLVSNNNILEFNSFPKLMPPLPVRYFQHFKSKLIFGDVFNEFNLLQQKTGYCVSLNSLLNQFKNEESLPPRETELIRQAFSNLVLRRLRDKSVIIQLVDQDDLPKYIAGHSRLICSSLLEFERKRPDKLVEHINVIHQELIQINDQNIQNISNRMCTVAKNQQIVLDDRVEILRQLAEDIITAMNSRMKNQTNEIIRKNEAKVREIEAELDSEERKILEQLKQSKQEALEEINKEIAEFRKQLDQKVNSSYNVDRYATYQAFESRTNEAKRKLKEILMIIKEK